jgi:hypothetical protein
MRLEDMRYWLRRQPFKPFRFFLVDGSFHEVRHPDQVFLETHALHLSCPFQPEGAEEQEITIALLYVIRLETLPPKVGSNGG